MVSRKKISILFKYLYIISNLFILGYAFKTCYSIAMKDINHKEEIKYIIITERINKPESLYNEFINDMDNYYPEIIDIERDFYIDEEIDNKKEDSNKNVIVKKESNKVITNNKPKEIKSTMIKATRGMNLPRSTKGLFKSYMDYRKITSKSSDQYKLQHSGKVYTDNNGLRKVDDCYMIAIGSYYANHIGDKFRITLDNGKVFNAIVGDFKANKDTDGNNQYHIVDKSIIEFIVDNKKLNHDSKKMGNIIHDGFNGGIKYIEKIINSNNEEDENNNEDIDNTPPEGY